MGAQLARYWFLLSILLIVVVYFAGVSTDARVFGDVINKLSLTLTGRDTSGHFADFPGNAPQIK
ncbi:MAG: hypothetical protein ACXWQZ_24995 [Ktedonobacterales bacterium]